MSVSTSLRCDHREPGADRCPTRLDIDSAEVPPSLVRREARRAGWHSDRRNVDRCPAHAPTSTSRRR